MKFVMDKIKNLFSSLDITDLKIMKIGIKFCFVFALIATFLLCVYLLFAHNLFLYSLGLAVFKLSTYIAVEFVVCGVVVDLIKKQIDV